VECSYNPAEGSAVHTLQVTAIEISIVMLSSHIKKANTIEGVHLCMYNLIGHAQCQKTHTHTHSQFLRMYPTELHLIYADSV